MHRPYSYWGRFGFFIFLICPKLASNTFLQNFLPKFVKWPCCVWEHLFVCWTYACTVWYSSVATTPIFANFTLLWRKARDSLVRNWDYVRGALMGMTWICQLGIRARSVIIARWEHDSPAWHGRGRTTEWCAPCERENCWLWLEI